MKIDGEGGVNLIDLEKVADKFSEEKILRNFNPAWTLKNVKISQLTLKKQHSQSESYFDQPTAVR